MNINQQIILDVAMAKICIVPCHRTYQRLGWTLEQWESFAATVDPKREPDMGPRRLENLRAGLARWKSLASGAAVVSTNELQRLNK